MNTPDTNKVDVLAVLLRDAKAASIERWGSRNPNETLYLMQMDEDAEKALAAVAELIEAAKDCANGYNHPRLRAALSRFT